MIASKIKQLFLDKTQRLFLSLTLVNLGNYGINLILGRLLGPVDFAEAGVLATLTLILSFIAIGLQMTATHFVGKNPNDAGKTNQSLYSWSLTLGLSLALIGILSHQFVSDFLQMESRAAIIVFMLGIPVYFTLSIKRGIYQGRQKFEAYTASFVHEFLGRLVGTTLFYFSFKAIGLETGLAIALGFFVSFACGHLAVKVANLRFRPSFDFLKNVPLRNFFIVLIGYECAQIMINYADVLLVKHHFTAEESGQYIALSLVGKAVFFATWTVITIMVPKMIELKNDKQAQNALLRNSLAVVLGLGMAMTSITFVFQDLITNVLFGAEYASIAPLLWKYAFATTLFSASSIFTYYYINLKQNFVVYISGLAGLLQIAILATYHSSLNQVVTIQIACMGALFLVLLILHYAKNTQHEKIAGRYRFSLSTK